MKVEKWQKQIWKCPMCGFKTLSLLEKDIHIQKTRNDKFHRQIEEFDMKQLIEIII